MRLERYKLGKEVERQVEATAPYSARVRVDDEDYNWEGYLERLSSMGFEKVFVELQKGQRGSQLPLKVSFNPFQSLWIPLDPFGRRLLLLCLGSRCCRTEAQRTCSMSYLLRKS